MNLYEKLHFEERQEEILPEDEAEQFSQTWDEIGGTHNPAGMQFCTEKSLQKNVEAWKKLFRADRNSDLILREFQAGKTKALVVHLDGVTDTKILDDMVLRPLMRCGCKTLEQAQQRILPVKSITLLTQGEQMVSEVLEGNAVIQLDGDARALSVEVRNFTHRSVGQTIHEKVLKGPQQGFVEHLRTNISLIRSIVRTPDLVTEMLPPSGDNRLRCALLYRDGVANPQLVNRVREMAKQADAKGFFMGGGMLEQLMKKRQSLVPQTLQTERPDRVAAYLTTGHLAIVCDGYPFVMVLPVTFFSLMQTSDDYFIPPFLATMARVVRLISLLTALLLPAIYLAMIVYHRELLSIKFLIASQALRQLVSIPVFAELLLMDAVFELLREASLRVQSGINQTLGIIGGIILGQAAVTANIVSPIAIIIVAATGLASYAIPNDVLQLTVYRMRLVLMTASLLGGFWGIIMALLPIIAIAGSTRSFGVAFFAPIAPRTRHTRDLIRRGRAGVTGDREDYMGGSADTQKSGAPTGGEEAQQ